MPRLLFIFFGFCLVSGPLAAQPAILDTALTRHGAVELLTFTLSGPVEEQTSFLLDAPDRLVVDLETVKGSGVSLPGKAPSGLVRNIRFGQFDKDTSRLVIELAERPADFRIRQSNTAEAYQHRLVIELSTSQGAVSAGQERKPINSPYSAIVPIFKPDITPRKSGKPLIIIDAGHGGKDPGATGSSGVLEKGITLAYAKALKKTLLATGHYRVKLTREDDRFLLLGERVRLAVNARGDVFLSIHADSAPKPNARGLSVYTLSETASDAESALLAAQENRVDEIAGIDLSGEEKEVADILIDLAQRESRNKSSALADTLVDSFRRKNIPLLPNTHSFAGFRVLKSTNIPSALIETGFISSPEDERRLKSDDYRREVTEGVAMALDAYFAGRKP